MGSRAPGRTSRPSASWAAGPVSSGGASTRTSTNRARSSTPTRQLVPAVVGPLDDPDRQVVEELVGDDDPVEGHHRELVEGSHHRSGVRYRSGRLVGGGAHERSEGVGRRFERQEVVGLGAETGRALDEHGSHGGRARRLAAQHVGEQPAASPSGVDDEEGVGPAEAPPRLVEGAGDEDAEEPADLGAGDEVVVGPAGAAAVSEVGVERGSLKRGERDRPDAVDVCSELGGGAGVRHGPSPRDAGEPTGLR